MTNWKHISLYLMGCCTWSMIVTYLLQIGVIKN